MPRKLRDKCVNGHPFTPENVRIRLVSLWAKRTEAYKTYRVRECIRCTRVNGRHKSRRRRALGKQACFSAHPDAVAKRYDGCACGKLKEYRAKTCRACYAAQFRRQPQRTE